MATKSWNQPATVVTVRPNLDQSPAGQFQGRQQTFNNGALERLDWAYFNKDSGDLSDPYQSRRIRANSSNETTLRERF